MLDSMSDTGAFILKGCLGFLGQACVLLKLWVFYLRELTSRPETSQLWYFLARMAQQMGHLQMPPMEPHVAAHLHPQRSALSSSSLAVPSKADRLQSALPERAYRAAELNARALNVLSAHGSLLRLSGHSDHGAAGTCALADPR